MEECLLHPYLVRVPHQVHPRLSQAAVLTSFIINLINRFTCKRASESNPRITTLIVPSCHSPYHDIFRGTQSGSQIFRELLSSENETIGKHFGRPLHGELYDGQSVLADRVSQQLLRDHAKLSPSLDLSSCSPFPDRMSGM
ncbi:hypothetical protein Acr_18g0009890 [Actinidia rufa]|uniref:Uncharacterized protein n=1 Tax=Actinidia rufa TaxID=165716 RepID=A0A7J0G7R3_9ERIC|nr:hypothetical protein Acr_18g0009890 [Actinidia rufa]